MNIYFEKCQNSSKLNKTDCYSDEIINMKLDTVFITSLMSNYHLKLDDVNQPFKSYLKSSISPLSTSIFKNHILEISEVRINSNKNLIFGSYEEEKQYKLEVQREEVDLRKVHAVKPRAFSQMTIRTSPNTYIIYREYKKLLDILIKIGGFFNTIYYFTTIFLFVYSKNLIYWKSINCLLSSNEINERINPNYPKNIDFNIKNISNNNKSHIMKIDKPINEIGKHESEENIRRDENNLEQLRINKFENNLNREDIHDNR
jgi:hypothetical protein